MFRKTLKIIVGLLLLVAVTIGITSINHPIILKWLSGSARIIGKPVNAIVYTNGILNTEIKVFHVGSYWNKTKADYYLLYISYADKSKLKVISLNRKDKYAGVPSATNIRDYDFIYGQLFPSEVGAKFSPFTDKAKGYNFDPRLSFVENQISLKIPPIVKELKFDSIRIVL